MKNEFLFVIIFLFSNVCFLKAQDTTAVCVTPKERENNSFLRVYPNPSNGTFQILYASPTSCPPPGWGGLLVVNIIDSNGKTVYTETISDFEGEYSRTIDLSGQQKGDFIIEVVSGKQKKIKRETLY